LVPRSHLDCHFVSPPPFWQLNCHFGNVKIVKMPFWHTPVVLALLRCHFVNVKMPFWHVLPFCPPAAVLARTLSHLRLLCRVLCFVTPNTRLICRVLCFVLDISCFAYRDIKYLKFLSCIVFRACFVVFWLSYHAYHTVLLFSKRFAVNPVQLVLSRSIAAFFFINFYAAGLCKSPMIC
jgi:hypothetical protein